MDDHLQQIFNELKKLLKNYEPPLVATRDTNYRYELWSKKEVEIAKRLRKEVHFATIIIQSNYVGFYYMPIYVETGLMKIFKPELLSLLKGKSCFHIKSLDSNLMKQIVFALQKGFELYKQRGWV